ncbi:MAG: DUF5320 domain-containing protein [Candidatus Aminicenantes bacterium]|nr:DUF5320 domain-containing protein [Candidatus Aminicenantes bacterium]
MPTGDRTGPFGQGPMTGRGAGYCAGFAAPGYMNASPGRFGGRGPGFGRGRGFGMGRGMGYRGQATAPLYPYAPPYPARDEAEMLSQQAQHLEAHLNEIKERLAKLEETPEPKK